MRMLAALLVGAAVVALDRPDDAADLVAKTTEDARRGAALAREACRIAPERCPVPLTRRREP